MPLSSDIISQFTKVTNDSKSAKPEAALHGTVVKYGESTYVRLDGSDELTPVARTVEVAEGDRVEVSIKNHTAIITGNTSDPSIGVVRAGELETSITQTAEEIRLEAKNTREELESSISVTASEIRNEVSDAVNGLNSTISQTAGAIRSEVNDAVTGLNSSIEQTAKDIRSEIVDEVNGLNSTIEQTAGAIRSEVEDKVKGLNSTIEQTEESINTKVSSTLVKVTVEYCKHTSSISPPDNNANWTTNTPVLEKGQYVWCRYKYTTQAGDVSYSTPMCISGIEDLDDELAELETQINQNASAIELKATKTSVDELGNRVSQAEASITVQADSITNLVTRDNEFSQFQQTVEGFMFKDNAGALHISGGAIYWSDADKPVQVEYSSDGVNWHRNYDAARDKYSRSKYTGQDTWGDVVVIRGEDGEDGTDGRDGRDGKDGSDATVTYQAMKSALNQAKQLFGDGITFIDDGMVSSPSIYGGRIVGSELWAGDGSSNFTRIDGQGFNLYSSKDSDSKIRMYVNTEGKEIYVRLGSGDNSGYNYFTIEKDTDSVAMYYYRQDGTPMGFTMDYTTGEISVSGKLKAAGSSDRIYATFA